MTPMTADELRALPAIVNLTTAARALGCGRTLAYDLARRGEFPCRVLRLGNRYLIPTAHLLRTLGLSAGNDDDTAEANTATAIDPDRPEETYASALRASVDAVAAPR